MACNNCNSEQSITHTTCNPCTPPVDCSCAVLLKTSCVNIYDGDDLECAGIQSGIPLNDVLKAMDAYVCEAILGNIPAVNLENIGTGAGVYAGVSNLGKRQLRKLKSSNASVTIVEGESDIDITVDGSETKIVAGTNTTVVGNGTIATPYSINANIVQETYSVSNLDNGGFYKGLTTPKVGINNNFEFKTLKLSQQGGVGETLIRDIQVNENDLTIRSKKIKSNTLTLTSTDEEITIDTPSLAVIPALYVNDVYRPTYEDWVNAGGNLVTAPSFLYSGEGTIAKPLTNSRRYTSTTTFIDTPNTAIQNALNKYSGGSRLTPVLIGQQIIIQNNNNEGYVFGGNFGYTDLRLRVQGSISCVTTEWLIDMDNATYFNSTNSFFIITIDEGAILNITQSLGVRNSGNTDTVNPFTTGRTGFFNGLGTLSCSYNGADVLSRYIFEGEGNNNNSNLHFEVKCRVSASHQGIYRTKNYQRIDFYNIIRSGVFLGTVNIALEAFRMEGGQVRFYEDGAISVESGSSSRTYGISFEPLGAVGQAFCRFELNSARVGYTCRYLFAKLNNFNVLFNAVSSVGSGATFFPLNSTTVIAGLFYNIGATRWQVSFRNNSYAFTGVDTTQVDLTNGNGESSVNTIGSSVVETLITSNDRSTAISTGLPLYSAYLKTGGVAYPNTVGWVRDIVLPA